MGSTEDRGIGMSADREDAPAPRRRGRRPGQTETRQAVLNAARARFSTDGFTATTIRAIAADAGVDAALVMQFFKSKDELFGAVMSVPPAALERMTDAWQGPRDGIGERVTRALLEAFENDAEASEPLLAMLRGAIAKEQAAAQLRDFLEARLMKGAQAHLRDDADTRLRVGVASAMLVGIIVARSVVRVPTVADEPLDTIITTTAPALQTLLAP
ncbi:TetR family transcriptional regulator [Actinocorallia sp. A-T 12471]|uniref:TetR/AcrR family transcriptional regulator n=1 Tax=Actinocorallia sp. A-T 12471 TaxID=3089813 RepID=UPI0029CC19F9|nr:TetR family transcriptional regulator [Actinocorallia sp. A-T 12471]MDX6740684.1 TetR family transcriptional regulator [Actinocorallia sp. A-T 12471]